jgi:hypothetical protein
MLVRQGGTQGLDHVYEALHVRPQEMKESSSVHIDSTVIRCNHHHNQGAHVQVQAVDIIEGATYHYPDTSGEVWVEVVEATVLPDGFVNVSGYWGSATNRLAYMPVALAPDLVLTQVGTVPNVEAVEA